MSSSKKSSQKPAPSSKPAAPPESSPALPVDLAVYDRAYAIRCFEARSERLDAMSEEGLASPRTDIKRAANKALALVAVVHEPAAHARFQFLAPKELDMAKFDDLLPLASMALYTHEEATAAGAFESEAMISPELAKESAEVENRMQKLNEHHFSDDPEIAPLLIEAAPGTSLTDRASDLLVYARAYELRPSIVASDVSHYRPTDVADARRLAAKINASVRDAQSPKARLWHDRCRKVFTLLEPCHAEVRQTWLWLERHNPAVAQQFPTLIAGGRAKKKPRSKPVVVLA